MNLPLSDILDRLHHLEQRVNVLEKENSSLKNGMVLKRKIDVLEWLNDELEIVPMMTFQKWILSLQYDKSIQTVFREGLITGIIELLDIGINDVSLKDSSYLPLRVFYQKQNLFYIYDIDDTNQDKETKWLLLSNTDLDKWITIICNKFLAEFHKWFKENEEMIQINEKMNDTYVLYFKRTLGDKRITEELRNQRVKQHIIKSIKQGHKELLEN
jgi:hypothetical protein